MNELDLDFAATAKPFASVVLCFTGVDHEQRTVLVNHAQQMGAVSKADLRSDVTHMVVGNVNTPKYQFAAQNRFDLKIMDLKWIEAAYEKWIQGEDVNFEETVTSHILPPLYGLKICMTNVASPEQRKLIEDQIRSNGGDYHPDLSKQCTHLLCASTTGKKYEAALKWGIQCVGIEWLFESIKRGMALEAKYFSLDIEPEKRGQGAWDRNAALKLFAPSALMDLSFETTAPIEPDNGTRKRRVRRAGSQIAQQGIWEGILGGVTDAQAAHQNLPTKEANLEETFNRLPISIVEDPSGDRINKDYNDPVPGLFEGMIFYTWGFTDKQREVLADVITKNQGLMFMKPLPGSTHDISRSFTVIPFTVPREKAPLRYTGSEVVTEVWIERCIAANSTFSPGEMVMCKPMPGPFPRPFLQNIAISITGFSGPDLLHVERLLNLLGAHYYSNLTRKRSLLLTPDTQVAGPKMLKAKEWGIPVVNIGWLWEIAGGSEDVNIGRWSDRQVDLVRYTPDEASSNLKATYGNSASCPPAVGKATQSILDGCVIYVSRKLEGIAPELHSIAEHLGAQVTKTFDSTQLTHMIHQSSHVSETFREFRPARTANIHIVHPEWLYQCRSRGMRCGEDAWAWMRDADKSLRVIGLSEPNAAPLETRREKRLRQDENIPPDRTVYPNEPVKLEQLTKLLGNVSSPQRKTKRRLAGRARNTEVSTTASSIASPEDIFLQIDEEEAPKPTQEKVEYKDPVAEREMAKIVANLLGITEEERMAQIESNSMTPAEDIGRRSARRKSARKS